MEELILTTKLNKESKITFWKNQNNGNCLVG